MKTEPNSKRGKDWLSNVMNGLTHDNTSVVTRPGAKEVLNEVFKAVRVAYRTIHIPTSLAKIDDKYLERVNWPRSIYKYSVLKEQIVDFTRVKNEPCEYMYILEELKDDICWVPSSTYEFDPSLQRNVRALRKAAGLPEGGKKAEALQGAIQYNDNVVKPSNSIEQMWADVPGYRTQQSEPSEPKIRWIFARCTHRWVMECEALDDSITKTVEQSKQLDKRYQVMYFDVRTGLKEWMNKFNDTVTMWVYIDATRYDKDVQSEEIGACWTYLAPDYPYLQLMIDSSIHNVIVTPEGVVVCNGGMSSGSKITNMGDGISNLLDNLEVLKILRLDKYVVCVLVNGDDITFGFSTRLTDENMRKWANLSRRDVSSEKSERFEDSLLNSKWWCDGTILTRSIFRAINSLAFKEREASALSANAIYVAIARHQILMDVEEHPCYEVLAKNLAKYEEYTLGQAMDDPRWAETLDYFISTHDYMGDLEADEFVQSMKESRYATEFAI